MLTFPPYNQYTWWVKSFTRLQTFNITKNYIFYCFNLKYKQVHNNTNLHKSWQNIIKSWDSATCWVGYIYYTLLCSSLLTMYCPVIFFNHCTVYINFSLYWTKKYIIFFANITYLWRIRIQFLDCHKQWRNTFVESSS